MTKEDLSKLIDECCDDIFDRKEPLVNVKARLYYTLKKQLTLTDVVEPKGTCCLKPKKIGKVNDMFESWDECKNCGKEVL